MLRKVLRGVLAVLVLLYLFSMFWPGWLDRLPPGAQTAGGVVLLAVALLDVLAFASPAVARFLTGREE